MAGGQHPGSPPWQAGAGLLFLSILAGHPHDLRSVTKSVTSSLLGLSIAQGKWSGVDVPVLSQVPARLIEAVDDRKRAMTLGNLVDMRSGMAWTEYPYNEKSSFYLMSKARTGLGLF